MIRLFNRSNANLAKSLVACIFPDISGHSWSSNTNSGIAPALAIAIRFLSFAARFLNVPAIIILKGSVLFGNN